MSRKQIWAKFITLMPFFLLAVAIILAFRLSGSLETFGGVFAWVWGVLSPFFWGFVLAYIINIPVGSFQKLLKRSKNKFIQRRQRGLSVLIVLVLVLGIIGMALGFIIPAIVNSITIFITNIDDYWAGVMGLVDTINSWGIIELNMETIMGFFGNMFADFSIDALSQPLNAIMGVGSSIVNGVIAVISSIYILVEKDKLKASASKLARVFAPDNVSAAIGETLNRLSKYFRQYVKTQTLDGLILGTLVTIALTILGSPFALLLGVSLGILNYIPIFGSLVGTVVAIIIVMFTQDFTTGLVAAAVLIVIQQLDANFIQPRLMGETFSFSPLLIIVSITVGGAVWGVLGMIIAIPVAAIIKDILNELIEHYEKKKLVKATGDEQDPPDDVHK